MQKCPNCGSNLVVLNSKVGDRMLTMSSCSFCDIRRWHADDEPIDLSTVIDLTTEANPRARQRKDEPASENRSL